MRPVAIVTFIAFALAAPALAQDGAAAARSIEDCERLGGVDEYNRCLARFGPPASAVGAGTARPPRGADPEVETSSANRPTPAALPRPATARRGVPAGRAVAGGRKRASFTIVTGRARPARAAVPARGAAPARGTARPARRVSRR